MLKLCQFRDRYITCWYNFISLRPLRPLRCVRVITAAMFSIVRRTVEISMLSVRRNKPASSHAVNKT